MVNVGHFYGFISLLVGLRECFLNDDEESIAVGNFDFERVLLGGLTNGRADAKIFAKAKVDFSGLPSG